MSKRLQVILDDEEMAEIRAVAQRQQVSVAEWVRRALRAARDAQPRSDASRKLAAVRHAVTHSFPTADMDRMLEEIESGYQPR